MKILFIGGNGNISWWCVQEAIKAKNQVVELNRAITRNSRRAVQAEVHQIIADIRDTASVLNALGNETFDVICDFICFNAEQAQQAVNLFRDRTRQYIVISSEAVYKRESRFLPFREDTPLYSEDVASNYISGKIQVEKVFRKAYIEENFPVTIVRPGYTYDAIVPIPVGQNCFTAPQKLLEGYPLLMPGDGENLWSPLHSEDFAKAFVGLIGNKKAVGDEYQIAGDIPITWNEMASQLLSALGLNKKCIIHIPRDEALKITAFQDEILVQQRLSHNIYDNSKIKSMANGWKQQISFEEGIERTVKWLFKADSRRRINPAYDEALERLYRIYWKRC